MIVPLVFCSIWGDHLRNEVQDVSNSVVKIPDKLGECTTLLIDSD